MVADGVLIEGESSGVDSAESELPLEVLEQSLTQWAVHIAAAEAKWLRWLGEYDARQGWRQWGCSSAAHWLNWKCAMTSVVARERVRVAAVLRELPMIAAAFEAGRLSFSKVRAMTRVANPFNEEDLVSMAEHATGAQLESICRGLRNSTAVEDTAAAAFASRRWAERCDYDNEVTTFVLRVPRSAGAAINAAVEAEADRIIDDAVGEAGDLSRREVIFDRGGVAAIRADAAVAILTGESASSMPVPTDITLVATQPSAGPSVASATKVPAGTPTAVSVASATEAPVGAGLLAATAEAATKASTGTRSSAAAAVDQSVVPATKVPAGTPPTEALTPAGSGSAFAVRTIDRLNIVVDGRIVAQSTAERLCCDPRLTPLLEDAQRTPVGVGRASRLIGAALRKALHRRDAAHCRFPGCAATRRLHAHHVIHWASGGETELDNLILLCPFHHHLVHEGGWTVDPVSYDFIRPDNTVVDPTPSVIGLTPIELTELIDWPETNPITLEPPNYDAFDLAWATTILHHNETVRRRETAGYDRATTDTADGPGPPT